MNEWHSTAAWRLRYIAGAHTRAKRLEALRSSFHRELDYSIITPIALYGHDAHRIYSAAPDRQALRIIEAKERYEREIQKEQRLAEEWQDILDRMEPEDRSVMDYHFRKGKRITRQARLHLLSKYKQLLDRMEQETEKARTEQAKQEEERRKQSDGWLDTSNKRRYYIIGGEMVSMTAKEYESHLLQESIRRSIEERKMFMDQVGWSV